MVVVSGEADERLPAGPQGERGAQGNQGNRGERGQLSRVQGRAVVVLFALSALFGIGNLFWTAHEVNAATAAQRQGAVLGQRLCITLDRLAALKPPAGNPAANPARAFDQEQQTVLAQLGPDVGCKR